VHRPSRLLAAFFQTHTMLGSPGKCARVAEQLSAWGADEVACLIDFGLETETVLAALPRLAELAAHFAGGTAVTPAEERAASGSGA